MKSFGFIGLGLIGGSMAKAIRSSSPDAQIIAFDRNEDSVRQAILDGVVNTACEDCDPLFTECDYIFLCAPVEVNLRCLEWLKDSVSSKCIITDVGSVKGPIHNRSEELGLQDNFIGGHPMAGSEKTGYTSSNEKLFENAYYILTPGSNIGLDKISDFTELVSSIGAIPMVLTPEEHDFITAAVSHLPQIIASSLVNLVKLLDNEAGYMKAIAAGGFRDITRIASSSPDMWRQICLENPENISNVLDDYIRMLIQIRYNIDHKEADALYELFESSKEYRDSIVHER
ncbi:MAG: prephenate dehydrogenase/arogenate dehydrogenase family protein [Blautia sp.]|nr:prephenate dehydrogenase/arogenate dehydrogenase family protein [Blautia sp.]